MKRITNHTLPFDWRTNNCIHSVAEVINAYHKCDCIDDFGFEFKDSEAANFKELKKKGYKDLVSLFDAHMKRKSAKFAKTGDICVDNNCSGVYQYSHAVFWGDEGLYYLPRAELGIVFDLTTYKAR